MRRKNDLCGDRCYALGLCEESLSICLSQDSETDRLEQQYSTQTDWREKGEMSPIANFLKPPIKWQSIRRRSVLSHHSVALSPLSHILTTQLKYYCTTIQSHCVVIQSHCAVANRNRLLLTQVFLKKTFFR